MRRTKKAKRPSPARPSPDRGGRPQKFPEDRLGTQIALRLDPQLVRRLDAHVERLKTRDPGVTWSRGAAIRTLMNEGLRRHEREAKAVATARESEARDLEDAIVTALRAASARGGRGTVATLRRAFPGVPRDIVDAALVDLELRGELSLERDGATGDLAALTADERKAALVDPVRGHLSFVRLIPRARH